MVEFSVIGEITAIEPIARGLGIRDRARLNRLYGRALIRLRNGRIRRAELHWYEAHGMGRREIKRKRYLD
jgi:hypothetical protein